MRFRQLAAVPVALASLSLACGGSDPAPSAGSLFCREARNVSEQLDQIFLSPDLNTEDIEAIVDDLRGLTPPQEIKVDLQILLDAFNQLAEISRSAESGDQQAAVSAGEQLTALTERGIERSAQNVEAYLAFDCGIALELDE